MEGMVRQTMANLARHQPAGLATGDFGGATAEMMRRGANAVEALSRPSDAPGSRAPAFAPTYFADAFSDALKQGMAWMPAAPPPPAPSRANPPQEPAPETFNPMLPFATLFDAFAKGMQGAIDETGSPSVPPATPVPEQAAAPAQKAESSPHGAPAEDAASDLDDGMVGDLLRSGQKMQADYAREMASLFERYQVPSKAN
jgi:hypothetical protein